MSGGGEAQIEDVDIDYVLEGHGWADCTVKIGGRDAKFAASYLRDSILEKHGVDGYREQWRNHPFPLEDYERLKRALRAPN
jgi:hypothetical protein